VCVVVVMLQLLFKLPPGAYASGGPSPAEAVVLPAPAIGQALGLGHGGEELCGQDLVPESTVERLGKAVLPRRCCFDVGRVGAAVLAPALEGVGNQLRPAVAADVGRSRVDAGQRLQQHHYVPGLASSAASDRQVEPAVLVTHLEELEPPPIGGGVELEVQCPHLVGMFSLVTPHRAVSGACQLLLARSRALESFLPPEPVQPFVVHQPAFPEQPEVSHPPSPSDVLSSDLPESTPELGFLDLYDLAAMALGAAVLAHHPLGKPLRKPEHGAQGLNSPAATLRAQKFPSANSLRMAFSSSASARSLLSCEFSFSSWVSRLASSSCMPP